MISSIIAQAVDFTETYKKYKDAHVSIREAMCLKAQYPALLEDIRSEDLFAGRRADNRIVYVGPIWWYAFPGYSDANLREGKQGGYCFDFSALSKVVTNVREQQILEELTEFWRKECTLSKIYSHWDDDLNKYTGENCQIRGFDVAFAVALDLDRLVCRGIPGLMKDISVKRSIIEKNAGETGFFDGLRIALEVMLDVCNYYKKQAYYLAERAETCNDKKRLEEIALALDGIMQHAPRSLKEAIQLIWLYLLLACGKHQEAWRLDVALGDFFVNDIEQGIVTEEEGVQLILSLWRLINETGDATVCRVIIGGLGRRNEVNADRFTMAALEATKRHKKVTPQVSLRFYDGQNPELIKKAYDTIQETYTFPTLYNDDVIIPGVSQILGVSWEEAKRYHPLGCGEYMLGGCSPSMLNVSWNIPKALEAALHDGTDCNGVCIGLHSGAIDTLDTFEKLYDAVLMQIGFAAGLSARVYRYIIKTMPKECAFLFASLLTDDCLESGKPLFNGGVRYMGACAMGHGFTNTADALIAIKKVVYEENHFSLSELVGALDSNFEGHNAMRKMLLQAPKFGNDIDEVDDLLVDLWRYINKSAREAGIKMGFDFHTVSSVNPGGYFLGRVTGATADGRKMGEPFAIGNSPTAGFDKNGLTALFNSVAKVDPANGGAITNFKISRQLFTEERDKLEMMFGTYFENGGMQANISVINKDDLQSALKEPDKYTHLLVRLGGWTARFIDLERTIQKEIIQRTLY